MSLGAKKTVGFAEKIIDVTIDTEEQRELGVLPACGKSNINVKDDYDGPIRQIYLDKFGLGGENKKLVFDHQAKNSWVQNILTGRGLKRKFTQKQLRERERLHKEQMRLSQEYQNE